MSEYNKHVVGDLVYFTSPLFDELGVKHAFTTRLGGVSSGIYESLNLSVNSGDDIEAVRKNHKILGDALGFNPKDATYAVQVHSDHVLVAGEHTRGMWYEKEADYAADALISKDNPIMVFGADCLCTLIYAKDVNVCAAVHSGWKGTVCKILSKTVSILTDEFGATPENIFCAQGPCISKCCFEVQGDVYAQFKTAFSDVADRHITHTKSGYMVDLKAFNLHLLTECSIPVSNIDVCPYCTSCHSELFWSHRKTRGKRGVQGGLIIPQGVLL